jgi:hypothetical protein
MTPLCPACDDTGWRWHHGFEREMECEDCPRCEHGELFGHCERCEATKEEEKAA